MRILLTIKDVSPLAEVAGALADAYVSYNFCRGRLDDALADPGTKPEVLSETAAAVAAVSRNLNALVAAAEKFCRGFRELSKFPVNEDAEHRWLNVLAEDCVRHLDAIRRVCGAWEKARLRSEDSPSQ